MNGVVHNQVWVATKFKAPRLARTSIVRNKLLERLKAATDMRLVLLKAPAGFGKSELASAWAERLGALGHQVAWLALDESDDDAIGFLLSLSHALAQGLSGADATSGGLLRDRGLATPRNIASTLINHLADSAHEQFIFLDDCHVMTDREAVEILRFLIVHTSSNVHWIITSRQEPDLPLTQLLARNQLVEIDATVLRFELDETLLFVRQEHGERFGAELIKSLHATTEGWPAALRIVCSSLRDAQSPPVWLSRLAGSHRNIDAYLLRIIENLPAALKDFMHRTAILERLCVELCDAVTASNFGAEALAALADQQLLLIPLDAEGRWYRYHHLLQDYLRSRLSQKPEIDVGGLHRRAGQWFARGDLWTDAIRHAIHAGDFDQAVLWMAPYAVNLVRQGDLLTLLQWSRQLPSHLVRQQPRVRLAIVWGLTLAMRAQEALALMEDISQDNALQSGPQAREFRYELEVIRAALHCLHDNLPAAATAIESALRLKARDEAWPTNSLYNAIRYKHFFEGNLVAYYATPWLPDDGSGDSRQVLVTGYRLCIQGLVEMIQGNGVLAGKHYQEAMHYGSQHGGSDSAMAAMPAPLYAEVLYESNQPDEAEALIVDRLDIIRVTGFLDVVFIAYRVLARIAHLRGDTGAAFALLQQAEEFAQCRGWGRVVAAVQMERIYLYLADGQVTRVRSCHERLRQLCEQHPVTAGRSSWSWIHDGSAHAGALIAMTEGRHADALETLDRLLASSLEFHRGQYRLILLLHRAHALLALGQGELARQSMDTAYRLAEAGGLQRTLIDHVNPFGAQGPCSASMLGLLEKAMADQNRHAEFNAWFKPAVVRVDSLGTETLTDREREILELVASGMSDKEIGRALSIVPDTVKYHMKRVFSRLGVQKRAHAVARARILGAIPAR